MAPQLCPFCHREPARKTNEEGHHYLECSNLIDCPGWPYTNAYPEEADAIHDWNLITRPEPDSSSLKTPN